MPLSIELGNCPKRVGGVIPPSVLSTESTPMKADVAKAFAEMPSDLRESLMEVRDLIFRAAEDHDVGALTETLKWGQPSYLTEATGDGTTILLGAPKDDPDHAAMFVHCQTSLIDEFRSLFPDELSYEGNRAVLVPLKGALPANALGSCVGLALTYHRRKKARLA